MELFSEWVLDEARQIKLRPKKEKHAAVAHTDIDRWLKSVDGLAKDLSALKDAKKKAQDKMDQIGQKYKSDEKPDKHTDEKPDDKHIEEKPDERKPKQPRPDADREVPHERPEREPDEAVIKRRLSKPDRREDAPPVSKRPKRDDDVETDRKRPRIRPAPVEDEDME